MSVCVFLVVNLAQTHGSKAIIWARHVQLEVSSGSIEAKIEELVAELVTNLRQS
jgi:hypothetical protein